MVFKLDGSLDVYAKAITFSAKRAEILANNIANVDTPNFKAKDLDFKALMQDMGGSITKPLKTNDSHLQQDISLDSFGALRFKVGLTEGLDGNTVNKEQEVISFAKNVEFYKANLVFINGTLSTLKQAIKGES